MSGHSKWSTIKRKKEKEDAKRGKIFTKLIKEITVAARQGGGDPEANPTLRTAIQNAKASNMPQTNIDRAIKKGTGELPGAVYEQVTYEGYGPQGVALLIESLTDNKNRTVSDIRHILSKHNGHLGETGSVAWMFDQKGVISVEEANEDELLALALEAGAEDMRSEDSSYEIIIPPEKLQAVKKKLKERGIEYQSAQITRIPQTIIKLEGKAAEQTLRLMEALDDHDDVQNVYSNFDIDVSIMEEVSSR
jgi:YebC/PmpR family DNA-binding regulatory protein